MPPPERPAPRADPLAALSSLPAVVEAVEAARQACTELRWHPALRRRTAEVRTEACVRAAAASAEVDGVRLPLAQVRAMVAASSDGRPAVVDPVEAAVRGALRATLDVHQASRTLSRAPAQTLARLHTLAAGDLVGPSAAASAAPSAAPSAAASAAPSAAPSAAAWAPGRPAAGGDTIGRPVPAAAPRVEGLLRLLAGGTDAPALVLAALADAELTTTGAFVPAGGVVARALARAVVVGGGLDPHGVVVPERHALADTAGRQAALAGYATGSPDGVQAWVVWWGEAVVAGAQQGRRVADEVMAGRLA